MAQDRVPRLRWYHNTSRGHWLALAAALLGWMFDGFEQGIFPLVARPALIDVLDLSAEHERAAFASDAGERQRARERVDGEVGLWNGRITAAFLLGAALGGWLFGGLGDRLGRVRAMALSVLTYSLFTGLCGLAQDRYQLTGLRFLAALGMGGEWALGVALVMESWAPHARPVLAGLIGAAANVGYILTPLLVMALTAAGLRVDAGGWRWVLGVCAFPALLTFLLRLFVPESERWREAVAGGPRPGLTAIFAPALYRRTLIGAALSATALIGTWGSVQWIPLWVNKLTHGSQEMTNYAQMCSGLGAVLGCLGGALLGQYAGRRASYFALGLGSLLVCAYLFRWHLGLFGEVDWRFLAVVLVTGALTASFYGWLPLYLPELFPTRVRATGQGFAYNCGRVIAAAGALSTGFLMQGVFAGDYARACATISLVYVAGLALVWLAPETRGRPLPE
jgi:MFS family permease